jgi:hypothetical protein
MDNVENTAQPIENSDRKEWELLEKERKVVDLRHMGITFEVIAKEVGYASPSGAYHAYERALARYPKETIDRKRELAETRIERLLAGVWTKALRGEIPAIMATIKIFERQAKLLGLDAPQKTETDITVYEGGSEIDEQVRRFAYLVAEARNEINASGFTNGVAPVLGIGSADESNTTGDQLADLVDPVGAGLGQDAVRGGMDSMGSDPESENSLGDSGADCG